jgi:hypothetical protein
MAMCAALTFCGPMAMAQSPERDSQDIRQGRITLIDAGTPIPIRTQESIDAQAKSERVYRGMVDQDVRDAKGHIAIPRGTPVDLKVRIGPDKDLVLDIESIDVNTQRFGVWSEADRVEAVSGDNLLATIVDPAPGLEVRGVAVRVPRDSVLTFRIEHTMIAGLQVGDPGEPLYARKNLGDLR